MKTDGLQAQLSTLIAAATGTLAAAVPSPLQSLHGPPAPPPGTLLPRGPGNGRQVSTAIPLLTSQLRSKAAVSAVATSKTFLLQKTPPPKS